jgi:3-methyladenine DNA glycosylase AlkC
MPLKNKNMSNRLQTGRMYQNRRDEFSAFAERIFRKAIFLKNETTKTLLRTVKTSILEPEKTTALSDEACLPRLCFERNFMMEDTL